MSNVYIKNCYYKILENRTPRRARDRYVEYYKDLHKLYKKEISDETFCEGPGYSYTELGASVLDQCEKAGELIDVDLMIVVYWAHEFDPDHSSCGPFFSERYGIKGPILDICDQGTISFFIGLNVIKQYMANGNSKKAVLLALEQTSVPRDKSENHLLPSHNTAAAIILQQSNEQMPLRLVKSEILLENEILESPRSYSKMFNKISRQLFDGPFYYCLAIKRTGLFYKSYQFFKCKNQYPTKIGKTVSLESSNGYLPVIMFIQQLLTERNCDTTKYIVLIDEDILTLSTGYLILEYSNG